MKLEGKSKSLRTPDVVQRALHRLIKKVGEDIEALKFNTAIAAMMEFLNLVIQEKISVDDFRSFLIVLSPFAPHIAEELWASLGAEGLVVQQPWPVFDPALVAEAEATIVVQVNGKARAEIVVPNDASDAEVRAAAERSEKVQKWLAEKHVDRVVVVRNRLVNFVLRR